MVCPPDATFGAGGTIAICALTVSVLAVGIAAITTYFQWLSTSAQLITSLSERYDSQEMKKNRKSFAVKLLDEKKRNQIDLANSELVLELLEEIGYLTRRKALSTGMVWNHFFWYLERYFHAITEPTNLIKEARTTQGTSTIYKELEWLRKKLEKIDRKESNNGKYCPPSAAEVEKFLRYESQLEVEGASSATKRKR